VTSTAKNSAIVVWCNSRSSPH